MFSKTSGSEVLALKLQKQLIQLVCFWSVQRAPLIWILMEILVTFLVKESSVSFNLEALSENFA